jgi:predicted PurR-regulated permease PerM
MPRMTHLLLVLALIAVIVAGFHLAAPFLSAFILAVVLAQVMSPLAEALEARGLPMGAALTAVLLLTLLIGIAVLAFVIISLAQFAADVPSYVDQLLATAQDAAPALVSPALRSNLVGIIAQLIPTLLAALGELAGLAALSFLVFAFMLWEGRGLPARLGSAGPRAASVLESSYVYNVEVRQFMTITAMLGALTGGLMAVFLWFTGVDFAFLWGVLLFLMSFVPGVGLLIASLPPIILAFLQLGLRGGIIVLLGFFVITNVVAQFMKPKYLGQGLNLSRLAVFLSFIVWGAILGPVGALLAVPLTLLVKMLLDSFDETRWLAVVISGRPSEVEAPLPADEATAPVTLDPGGAQAEISR